MKEKLEELQRLLDEAKLKIEEPTQDNLRQAVECIAMLALRAKELALEIAS